MNPAVTAWNRGQFGSTAIVRFGSLIWGPAGKGQHLVADSYDPRNRAKANEATPTKPHSFRVAPCWFV